LTRHSNQTIQSSFVKATRLIDVGDFFIDLGDIAELVRKDTSESGDYGIPSFVPPGEVPIANVGDDR
jgi:hypothetical protein